VWGVSSKTHAACPSNPFSFPKGLASLFLNAPKAPVYCVAQNPGVARNRSSALRSKYFLKQSDVHLPWSFISSSEMPASLIALAPPRRKLRIPTRLISTKCTPCFSAISFKCFLSALLTTSPFGASGRASIFCFGLDQAGNKLASLLFIVSAFLIATHLLTMPPT